MHLRLLKFIEQFEREAAEKGLYRNKIGPSELAFLEGVWGPSFQYNYDGLKAEYPLKDFKGGQRFADFVFIKNGAKILIEIDGFTTHARNISPGDFNDHLTRQNDLVLSGWLILRFSTQQVEKEPTICQRYLKQAVGHWWSITHSGLFRNDANIWALRQQSVVDMALRQNGRIRPSDVAALFNISRTSASDWLKRYAEQGIFTPSTSNAKRVNFYRLAYFSDYEQ